MTCRIKFLGNGGELYLDEKFFHDCFITENKEFSFENIGIDDLSTILISVMNYPRLSYNVNKNFIKDSLKVYETLKWNHTETFLFEVLKVQIRFIWDQIIKIERQKLLKDSISLLTELEKNNFVKDWNCISYFRENLEKIIKTFIGENVYDLHDCIEIFRKNF
jgi:hypothetical protein